MMPELSLVYPHVVPAKSAALQLLQLQKHCGACGGELYQREDDKEAVIAKRLSVYQEQTAPIVHFYRTEGVACDNLCRW
jgi:adenylate kinase family enzyme